MTETQRIADELRKAFDGDTWCGRSIREIAGDFTGARAAAHPIAGAHSAWELLLHLTAWLSIARRRLGGEACNPTDDENVPTVTDQSDAAWKETWTRVEREYRALADAAEKFPDARLEETVPGKSYSAYHLLHGVIQHALYHAGQMAILARAAR